MTDSFSKTVDITADEFLYEGNEDYMVARGNVIANLDNFILYADSAYYDKKRQMIYVDGKVKIIKDFLGLGEGLKYDLKNREGFLKKIELNYFSEDKKKQKFIWGSEIIIRDSESFYLKDGYFSSCDGTKKPWYIKGTDINITLGEYLTAKHITLYASDIPVLYSPYFVAPVKKQKESGFLMPSFGFSGKHGFMLNQPYYFFLDESYDNTLSLNLRTEDTIGFDNEFRYKLSRIEDGIMNLSYYENYKINKDYLYLNLRHKKDNSIKIDANLLNRRDFFYEYKKETDEKSLPYLRSKAFLEKRTRRDNYSVSFFNGYNLNLNDRDLTVVSLNKDSYPVAINSYLFYNLDGSLNLFSHDSDSLERIIFKPRGSFRLPRQNYDISMDISGYLNFYSDELHKEEKKGYLIFQPAVKMYKNFLINQQYANKNSLSFSPSVPVKLFDNLYRTLDNKDQLNSDKRIDYYFEQKSYKLQTGKLIYNLYMNQSYIFENGSGEAQFSDLNGVFRVYGDYGTFGLTATLSHKNRDIKDFMSYLNIKKDNLNVNVNYLKTEQDNEYLNLNVSTGVKDNLIFSAGIRYDLVGDILKEVAFGTEYIKNCYSIKAELKNRKEPSEFNLFVYINLYGLGEIRQGL